MTKEDEKRNEIFFNETLAQDEIDRLLDPKVLTNFKRYTAKGEEKVADFKRDKDGTIRENLIIKGNNLLALHSLRKEFQGKVKLIYIDPPYNTELDSFNYNDNFSHSTLLTFMRNRLEVAKELLTENGTIFVQMDWHEAHYVKILLDEIFGRTNLINEIIWCYAGPGSPKMKQFNRKHDTIFWYRKGEDWTFNKDEIRIPYKDPNQSFRKAFAPDFVLFMKDKEGKEGTYQIFIEPKGPQFKGNDGTFASGMDGWKEKLLIEIKEMFESKGLTKFIETKKYKVVGVPFFNQLDENKFKEELLKSID